MTIFKFKIGALQKVFNISQTDQTSQLSKNTFGDSQVGILAWELV